MPPRQDRPRVASLLPAATEIVCALGRGGALVGVSHECDHPSEVLGLPVLTASRLDPHGGSPEIDAQVRRAIEEALAVYRVDVPALRAARPEVVVTQDLCDVCAVPFEAVRAALAELAGEVEVVRLSPMRLADIWEDVRAVGRALRAEREAAELTAAMDARVAQVRERAAAAGRRPAVLTIEWIDPVILGGTWMPELVELAGGRALVTRAGERAPTLGRDALAALDPAPEVVLVKPCGFPLERSRNERDALRAILAGLPWPALADGAVWLADGNAYFNRPGPRIVDSLEILAACVHPELFGDLAARHARSFERFA